MSAFTPAVLTTSYRLSVWMRGDSLSSSDSGWPMPPPAPAGARLAQRGAAQGARRSAQRTDDANLDGAGCVRAARGAPRQVRSRLRGRISWRTARGHAAPRSARARARQRARTCCDSASGASCADSVRSLRCTVASCASMAARPARALPERTEERRGAGDVVAARAKKRWTTRASHTHAPCAHRARRTTWSLRLIRTNPPAGASQST